MAVDYIRTQADNLKRSEAYVIELMVKTIGGDTIPEWFIPGMEKEADNGKAKPGP